MGGETTQTTQQSQQSQTEPWKPTQPYLQQALQQLGPALGNTGTSPGESSALQQLIANAQSMPNFGGVAGDLAGQLLNGTFQVNPSSTVGRSYDALKAQYAPYTGSGYLNPYKNPAFQSYLDTTTRDIGNRVNSMFAGAGRDLSGINQESLARGITEGTAPIFANQYNQNVGAQQHAIDSLFGGGLGASAAGVGNARTGLGVAGALPQLTNQNAQSLLQAYAQQYGLPLSKLGQAESLLLPIAQLGSQSSSTGSSNTTQQLPWYSTAQAVQGLLLGSGRSGNNGLLNFFGGAGGVPGSAGGAMGKVGFDGSAAAAAGSDATAAGAADLGGGIDLASLADLAFLL